jgi:hypothetical protein
MRRALPLAILTLASCRTAAPKRPDLTTVAERSAWLRTGRYDEAVRLCHDYATAFPGRARCDTFGTTAEERPLVALIVSGDGTLTPEQAAARRRPVLLVQAGIHAGEIEGKDAGFQILRELLDGTSVPGALDAVTVVFVPVINPDGHERFGKNNRPNQRGPEEMGFRTDAANLNLNRDYMKLDTPELDALVALWGRWDPVVYVDLHTTDGAKFQHDISVVVAPRNDRTLSDALQARLTELGHLPLDFYPAFVVDDDPASGFEDGDAPPRFSHAYAAARDRIGILVETHSWRTYPERVKSTHDALQALLERAIPDAAAWRDAADAADVAGATLAGRDVVLLQAAGPEVRTIDFLGYAYERRPSEVSGASWTSYDESKPETWKLPIRDHLVPAITVTAPKAGYLVTAGWADEIAARLDRHGITYQRLDSTRTLDAEVFRATAVTFPPPYEGRTPAKITGAWARETREVPPGALWIPIAQARGRLILELFEPTAPDSFAGWGFFNSVFEQKEFMEAYLVEEYARTMLEDPAVRAAFDEALKDAAFAASPEQRLAFFFRRHAAWDERKDLLPVLRLDATP